MGKYPNALEYYVNYFSFLCLRWTRRSLIVSMSYHVCYLCFDARVTKETLHHRRNFSLVLRLREFALHRNTVSDGTGPGVERGPCRHTVPTCTVIPTTPPPPPVLYQFPVSWWRRRRPAYVTWPALLPCRHRRIFRRRRRPDLLLRGRRSLRVFRRRHRRPLGFATWRPTPRIASTTTMVRRIPVCVQPLLYRRVFTSCKTVHRWVTQWVCSSVGESTFIWLFLKIFFKNIFFMSKF